MLSILYLSSIIQQNGFYLNGVKARRKDEKHVLWMTVRMALDDKSERLLLDIRIR